MGYINELAWKNLIKKQLTVPKSKSWEDVQWDHDEQEKTYKTTIGDKEVYIKEDKFGSYEIKIFLEKKSLFGLVRKREQIFSETTIGLTGAKFLSIIRSDITYLNHEDFLEAFREILDGFDTDYINYETLEVHGYGGFVDEDETSDRMGDEDTTTDEVVAVDGTLFFLDNPYSWKYKKDD